MLVAVSTTQILGYCIIEGAINQLFFAEFLLRISRWCKNDETLKNRRIVLLMDNLQAHKTSLIKAVQYKENFSIIFNARYSSELNFVEYIFHAIKRDVEKDGRKQTK